MGLLLDPLPGGVQGVVGELDDMERVHHRSRVWDRLGGSGLEPGESVHRHDLDFLAEVLGVVVEPGRKDLLRPARDHRDQPRWAALVSDRGQVDHDGHILVTQPGVAPDMLINTQAL